MSPSKTSNSAKQKLARAKRHLLAAKVLLGSLPSRFWQREKTANELDKIAEELLNTQQKVGELKDPDNHSPTREL